MLPQLNSPVINAGADAIPGDKDQRGFFRRPTGKSDIGAVGTSYTSSATSGTPQSTPTNAAFTKSLQANVLESGSSIAGVTVRFATPTSGPSGLFGGSNTATAVTDSSGIATAPTLTANSIAGTYVVTASVGGGVPVAVFNLTNLAVPSSILAAAGTPQNAPPGATFQTTLKATVRDSNNNLIQGISVTFTAPDNGASGTFAGGTTSATVATDVAGSATAPAFTANAIVGTYTVIASIGGNVTPTSFSLRNVVPGPPASFTATAGTPQTVTVGCDFLTSLRATVLDADSVPVGGITITFTVTPNGNNGAAFPAQAIVATAITDNNGNATAPILTANEFAGDYTVTATISELASPVTYSLTNRIKFGDLTGEGTVNVQDLLVMANTLAGNIHLSPGRKMMADVLQDSGHLINVQDLFVLANFLAGNISTLPVIPTEQNPGGMQSDYNVTAHQFAADWNDILNGYRVINALNTDDQTEEPSSGPVSLPQVSQGITLRPIFRISDLFWRPQPQVYAPTSR